MHQKFQKMIITEESISFKSSQGIKHFQKTELLIALYSSRLPYLHMF